MRVSDDVLSVLSASTTEAGALHLPNQLDRSLYAKVAKVIEAAGGKWERRAKAHLFPSGDAAARIDQIILTGDIVVPKDEFEFFPTPSEIADKVVKLADLQQGDRVLEPSAGTGALLAAMLRVEWRLNLTAIEKNPEMARGLRELYDGADVICQDFLTIDRPTPAFEAVVMNPPFSRQQDIKHVNHAARFLAPGGRLVAIMAAGVTFRQDRLATEFRAMVASRGGIIKPLPEGSFKKSGTGVNTVIVAFEA